MPPYWPEMTDSSAGRNTCPQLTTRAGIDRFGRWTGQDGTGITAQAMKIKTFLARTFTWWNGQTFGTQLWTALYGERIGEDEFGNTYYRTKGGKIDPALGFERRWVIYKDYAEASQIGPAWHGWMHHTVDTPPTDEAYRARSWEKPHRPNMTGTPGAQRPTGSTLAQGRRPKATGDYKAWVPGGRN
jgi:NADH:ubiquinone oxidoreductase subunit